MSFYSSTSWRRGRTAIEQEAMSCCIPPESPGTHRKLLCDDPHESARLRKRFEHPVVTEERQLKYPVACLVKLDELLRLRQVCRNRLLADHLLSSSPAASNHTRLKRDRQAQNHDRNIIPCQQGIKTTSRSLRRVEVGLHTRRRRESLSGQGQRVCTFLGARVDRFENERVRSRCHRWEVL